MDVVARTCDYRGGTGSGTGQWGLKCSSMRRLDYSRRARDGGRQWGGTSSGTK